MGLQGLLFETPKGYIPLVIYQSKTLLSGGQMSCKKNEVLCRPSMNKIEEAQLQTFVQQHSHIEINAWVKDFVQIELLGGNRSNDSELGRTPQSWNVLEQQNGMNEKKLQQVLNVIEADTGLITRTEYYNVNEQNGTLNVELWHHHAYVHSKRSKKILKIFRHYRFRGAPYRF